MKRTFTTFLAILLMSNTYSQRNYSVANGNWSNPAVWSSGSVPIENDSVIIDDYILLDTNITVGNGLLFIDGCGVLCGNYDVWGSFTNYGELRIRNGNITDTSFNYNLYSCSGYNIIYTNQGGSLENCCGGIVYTSYPVDCNGFPRACSNVLSADRNDYEEPLIIKNIPNGFEVILADEFVGSTLYVYGPDGRQLLLSVMNQKNTILTYNFPKGILLFRLGNNTTKAINF